MHSPTARAFAAAIALTAWTGLAVQLDASIGLTGSVGRALWTMARYFTVITNLLVAVVFTGLALGVRRFTAPLVVGGVTLAILLVGVVYALLLRGLVELSGGARLADFLNHTATPILVPIFWLAFARTGGLTRRDPWIWALLPLAYFAYALLRGATEGVYAYPFMDVGRLGGLRTILNGVGMAAGFLLAGFGLVRLDRRAGRPAV